LRQRTDSISPVSEEAMQQHLRQPEPESIEQMEPSLAKATTEEMFKCRNCGCEYATEGKNEGACPVCNQVCTRQSCRVGCFSNEGF
jgi:hypothetical protein